uniref:Nuclear receptor domain-containing protein n=1 Tax=Steinernema glaseri TaxID=37863 RepID=A0A1I8AV85_9BILA
MAELSGCPVCFKESPVCYNFGGICCRSCAAFFRRAVRSGKEPTCAKNHLLCKRSNVMVVGANNVGCKKCRLDRCFAHGMRPKFVHFANPKTESWVLEKDVCDDSYGMKCSELVVYYHAGLSISELSWNHETPILSGVTRAVREAYRYRSQVTMDLTKHRGTSEPGDRFCNYMHHRFLLYEEFKIFHYLMQKLPIIRDLDEAIMEQMFKNSLPLYSGFIRVLSNVLQKYPDRSRFYPYPNIYVDMDFEKLVTFLMPTLSMRSLAKRREDFADVAEFVLKSAHYCFQNGIAVAKQLIRTDEDLAAVILLIIITANDFNNSDPNWHGPIRKLKAVWKELDLHYRATSRDPAAWGNLILFLSNVETIGENGLKFVKIMQLFLGSSLFDYIEKSKRFQELEQQDLEFN